LGRLEGIPEAKEITVKIEKTKWMDRDISDHGEQVFAESVARRAKEFLMWKILAEEHVGVFAKEVVWEGDVVGLPTHYKVVATEPKGDLQVTPRTHVLILMQSAK